MESCSILLRAPHKSAAPAFSWVPTAARAERAWPKRIPDPTSSAPALLQLLRGLSLRELLQKHLQQHRNTSDGSPAHKLSPSSAAFLISPSLPALVFTSKRPPEHCKLFNFQQAALRSGKLKFKALIKAGKKKKKTCILRKKSKMKFSRRSSASEMGLPCARRVWWEVTEGRRNFVLPSPTSPSLEARGETGRRPRRGIMSQ